MRQKNITQADLAKRCNTTRASISSMLNHHTYGEQYKEKIAITLGIQPEEIVGIDLKTGLHKSKTVRPEKKCKLPGCILKHNSKGYCKKHYQYWKIHEGNGRKCTFANCNSPFYAKGLCKNHYSIYIRTGTPEYKIKHYEHCTVDGCLRPARSFGLCISHRFRQKNGIPIDTPISNKGSRNCNWKGGISGYPNHSAMKKVRLQKLRDVCFKCEVCGGIADRVHHKDLYRSNHSYDNLLAVCQKCHLTTFHKGERVKSSLSKIYGETLVQISKKLHIEISKVRRLHVAGKLIDYLK